MGRAGRSRVPFWRALHDHARRLLDPGHGREPAEYRYELTSGLKIDRPMRRVYREALVAAEANST
jgi:hypothetical protein